MRRGTRRGRKQPYPSSSAHKPINPPIQFNPTTTNSKWVDKRELKKELGSVEYGQNSGIGEKTDEIGGGFVGNYQNEVEIDRIEEDSIEKWVHKRELKRELGSEKDGENSGICEKREEIGGGFLGKEKIYRIEDDSIENRLAELELEKKEADLSEEVLKINDQLQEDEITVMESIYGENVFILDKQRGLRSFQIHINVEAPQAEFKISARLSSHGDLQAKDTNDELLYSFQVQYLPPIILTCLLPKSYPSHLPPHYTISVQWLNSENISKFCSMLDSIWEEQKGQEIIYSWVDWLQTSSLSYLGFDNEIMLGPFGVKSEKDRRAVSGSISPDVVIPSLKSYNDERRHESFCRNFQQCCICFSDYPGSDFVRLPCQHFFCANCMKTYSDIHIKEGTLTKLLCPEAKCGGMVPRGLLKWLLGNEEFERWESLMLQKTLDSMSDVVYCPRCETACIEDEENHAQCAKCFFSFCTLCRDRRHVGIICMTPENKLRVLQERQNSSQVKDEQKRKELEMINELLSVKEILRDAKQCPSCKMAISRIEGCNKMFCQNCERKFCYRCNKLIDGYDHFSDGACELFPQEEIRRWERRRNARQRQVVRQIQAPLYADNGHSCPLCRQINFKLGNNNDIFCWACENHYCYLCRETVKHSARHFGPKGCKQYTKGLTAT